MRVTGVNDQPSAANTTHTVTYPEDPGVPVDIDPATVVADIDANETITVTMTLADPDTGSLGSAAGGAYASPTWSITDSVANVNAALADLQFTPAADNDRDTAIDVRIFDGGENGTTAVAGTITLDVTPVNDQLSAAPTTFTVAYTEDPAGPVDVDGPTVVSDADTGETITVTMTLADPGTGSLGSAAGGVYAAPTWSITDTLANVNAALADLQFTPALNNDQDTTIAVSIADGNEDGTAAVTGTITLDVTPVNDQLTAAPISYTVTYPEDPAGPVDVDGPTVVSDVDTGETVTATLTLADPAAVSLSANDGAAYTAGTGVWTISDTLANVNTALAGLQLSPSGDNAQ